MNTKSIISIALIFLVCSIQTFAVTTQKSIIDPVLINQERIAYWLHKRNQLSDSLSPTQIDAAVNLYIDDYRLKLRRHNIAPMAFNVSNKTTSQKSKTNKYQVDEKTLTKVNVLAVLIDFPDLPYNDNRLTASDTAMYYRDYSRAHYNDLLFASDTFTGPNNERLITSRQYYYQGSGGTFSFIGKVFGWYRAQQDAAYYGGNNQSNGADNNARKLVLEAITAAVAVGKVYLAKYDLNNDGVVDHLLVFHSSVGGGVLGQDAIWSHRYYVDKEPVAVPGTTLFSLLMRLPESWHMNLVTCWA